MYAAAKQKQLLDFPLCLSYLDYRHVLNYSLSSFKDFIRLHKKSKAHTLPQSSCPVFLE